MSQMPFDNQHDVLRITRDEAYSEHVEDLLKRQMSLRGEGGIARDRKGRWYYQNWFIFMVAGILGSLAGWALLEPYFDDNYYIQGPIQELKQRLLGTAEYEVRLATPLNGRPIPLPPGSRLTSQGANWFQFQPEQAEHDNPRLLQALLQAGLPVFSLHEIPRSLEQVYLQVVQNQTNMEHQDG